MAGQETGVYSFNPNQLALSYAGGAIIGLAQADNAIRLLKLDPDYLEVTKGLYGDISFNKNPMNLWALEFDLMQESPSNNHMSACRTVDRAAEGVVLYPGLLTDKSGTSVYSWSKSVIEKVPDPSFGQRGTIRTWRAVIGDMFDYTGGSGLAADIVTTLFNEVGGLFS